LPGFPGLPCSSSGSSQQCCCFLPFTNSTGRGSTQGQDRRRGQFASDAHESAKDAYLLAQVTRVVFDGLQMTSNAVCNEGARSGCGHLHHAGQAQLQIKNFYAFRRSRVQARSNPGTGDRGGRCAAYIVSRQSLYLLDPP